MEEPLELTIAINILERKIAELNIQLAKDYDADLEKELNKILKLREEIYKGNKLLIKKVISDFENS